MNTDLSTAQESTSRLSRNKNTQMMDDSDYCNTTAATSGEDFGCYNEAMKVTRFVVVGSFIFRRNRYRYDSILRGDW